MKKKPGIRKYELYFLDGPLKGQVKYDPEQLPHQYSYKQGSSSRPDVAMNEWGLHEPVNYAKNEPVIYQLEWFHVSGKKTPDDQPVGVYLKKGYYKVKPKYMVKKKTGWEVPDWDENGNPIVQANIELEQTAAVDLQQMIPTGSVSLDKDQYLALYGGDRDQRPRNRR